MNGFRTRDLAKGDEQPAAILGTRDMGMEIMDCLNEEII